MSAAWLHQRGAACLVGGRVELVLSRTTQRRAHGHRWQRRRAQWAPAENGVVERHVDLQRLRLRSERETI